MARFTASEGASFGKVTEGQGNNAAPFQRGGLDSVDRRGLSMGVEIERLRGIQPVIFRLRSPMSLHPSQAPYQKRRITRHGRLHAFEFVQRRTSVADAEEA